MPAYEPRAASYEYHGASPEKLVKVFTNANKLVFLSEDKEKIEI
jgi:hypothetical protein